MRLRKITILVSSGLLSIVMLHYLNQAHIILALEGEPAYLEDEAYMQALRDTIQQPQESRFCGGVQELACPQNMICSLSSREKLAPGVCVELKKETYSEKEFLALPTNQQRYVRLALAGVDSDKKARVIHAFLGLGDEARKKYGEIVSSPYGHFVQETILHLDEINPMDRDELLENHATLVKQLLSFERVLGVRADASMKIKGLAKHILLLDQRLAHQTLLQEYLQKFLTLVDDFQDYLKEGYISYNNNKDWRDRYANSTRDIIKENERMLDNLGYYVFPDVSLFTISDKPTWDRRFYTFINRLKKRGIVGGFRDGLFHPERNVSRAEFIKMLTLLTVPRFDVQKWQGGLWEKSGLKLARDWQVPFVNYGVKYDFLNNLDGSIDAKITRAEAVHLLLQYFHVPASVNFTNFYEDVYPRHLYYKDIVTVAGLGIIDGRRERFYPDKAISRAETAKILLHGEELIDAMFKSVNNVSL